MNGKPTRISAFLVGFLFSCLFLAGLAGVLQPWRLLPSLLITRNAPTVSPSKVVAIETATPFQPLPNVTTTTTRTATPEPSHTPTSSPTPTTTPLPIETATPPATNTAVLPTATTAPGLPEQAFIQGYSGGVQSFSLDCEARSAVDLAAFFGIRIDEIEFIERLPRSDDPNEGFVGEFTDPWGEIPPESYGVYANPIARLLRNYGLNAYARYGMSLEDLRAEIAAGRPLMVWVIGQVDPGVPLSYTPSNGNRTTVAHYEHTVTVIGYDEDFVYIIDPAFNQFYMRSLDRFLESWGVLNNMAVAVEP